MAQGFWNKIYLLSWKNFILLKRQYIVTILEIVLPTLFTIALAYIRSQVKPGLGFRPPGETSFQEYSDQNLVDQLYDLFDRSWYDEETTIIGCSPKSGVPIMEKLIQKVKDYNYDNSYPRDFNVTIIGFDSETEMEAYQSSLWTDQESVYNNPFVFGIVFSGLSDTARSISYKIRMNNNYFYNTRDLMPINVYPGPDYGGATLYKNSGFAGIQLLLDKILIEDLTGSPPSEQISLQAFPYPEYKNWDIADLYNIFLPIFIVTGFVFVVPTVVRGVVSEKETGIKELMKMSGLPEWMHWFGWMLNSMCVLTITVTIVVVLLYVPFNSEAGAVFKYTDGTLMWVLLFVYAIWATTYCFMVSAFFERPTLATTAGIVIWMVSFYGLGFAAEMGYGKDFALGLKIFLCLFPNVAINQALKVICTFEATEKGAKWGNMADSINAVDSLNLLYPFLMMFVSMLVNMLICLYVEAVLPKKYGVRKPFYFIFQPSEWGFGSKSGKQASSVTENSDPIPGFEEQESGVQVGVEIRKLRKDFGAKTAVNDVSVKIFQDQIFCLLGENGAGKTTTMSMLTGLYAPTSGTAFIDGYDIRTDMNNIRQNLGLCPQHNMLFDKMTVMEHFKFFGMLKGLSSRKAMAEASTLLELLQITDKKYVLSTSLSGGQKRRVSLGCAIIGSSKVIFLDEPTSGMDPEARRAIWDILLKIREGRTIVLTTHFMEEADVLGDRIAIMASGLLQCCGSPNYLKRFYGAGYTLAMTIKDGANRETILNTVKNHIADAYFKGSLSNNASELAIVLPSENNTSSRFPALFVELREGQKKLGINEFGVGYTTMDEVFVRVEEMSHNSEQIGGRNGDVIEDNNSTSILLNNEKAKGVALTLSQFYGLLIKKFLWTVKRKRLIVTQMLIPVVMTIAAVAISGSVTSTSTMTPELKITIDAYKKAVTLYSSIDQNLGNIYATKVGSSAKELDAKFNYNVSEGLLAVGREDLSLYKERHIIAAEITRNSMKAMHSSLAPHSAPLSMNMLTNTILEVRKPGQGYKIEVTNHPFPNNLWDLFRPIEENSDFVLYISFIVGALIPIGMALLVGSFLIAPTEERLNQGKQLQLMTGVNPVLYWGSMYIIDYGLMLITICLMTAFIPAFEKNNTFTNYNGAGVFVLIMIVYGISTLFFTYIFSTFVRTVAGGFTLITMTHLVTGIGLGIGSHVLDLAQEGKFVTKFFNIVGRLFPTFGLTKGTIHYAQVSSKNSGCSALSNEAIRILCNPLFQPETIPYSRVTQECCDNCRELGSRKCFQPTPYFQWETDDYAPGLSQDLLWMGLMTIIYAIILVLIEYDVFQMILEKIKKETSIKFQQTVNDEDVLNENSRVSKLVAEGRTTEDAIVVNNLCKAFGDFSAVSSLSFGVQHGECFGLLGVNGAGKTTSFRMLTGDESRSNGNSFIDNVSLGIGRKTFLSKLGYCPQFDGIVGVLTGREMLSLFGRLRGIPSNLVNQEAEKWLRRTGLVKSGDVPCQKYSGGMKRRLSAAVALIGDPPVILLDEPTSGVDPVARRQFWKIISSIKNSGQAIILTSHSMEECEALCSRLGIMVNGEMQCLGGVQHLKNKFAQGYSLTLKLKQENYHNKELIDRISNDIFATFNPCSLKDCHQTTMKFQIHSQSRNWEDLYYTMERIKERNREGIEEYAITETTLEEVFLSFARAQYTNDRTAEGNRNCCSRLRIFK